MRRFGRRPLVLVAVFASVAALGLGAGAAASALNKPPTPPIIATVDLEEVVKGLDKRKQKEQEFLAKQNEFKTTLTATQKEIEGQQKE